MDPCKMTDREYRAVPALHQSDAKLLLASPMQFSASKATPRKDTDTFRLGRLVHAMTRGAESECWQPLPPAPDLSGLTDDKGKPYAAPERSTQGKAMLAAWQADCAPLLAKAELDQAIAADAAGWAEWCAKARPIADALRASKCPHTPWTLAQLLAMPTTKAELPVFWDADLGDGTTCPCACRPDWLVTLPDGRVLCLDGKTTTEQFTAADLSRAAVKWGYHREAAHYIEGLAANGVADAEFWFVYVQVSAPHEVAWLRASNRLLAAGAAEMAQAKAIFAACTAGKVWPSAQDAGTMDYELDLPRWYKGVDDE